VAPFILFLVFGSVEFARMAMIKQVLTSAARIGCREAALATTQSYLSCESAVRDRMKGSIVDYDDAEVARVIVSPAFTTPLDSGTEVTVTVEIDCADVSWLPPVFFGDAMIRGSSSTNRE
jgi:Flp pilus assembly protein TadG